MLDFLYTAVSWVLLRWHDLLVFLGFSEGSGFGWALSIILLVMTARLLLLRLFVKQVHYQRNMQKMQPKIKKIREKYKDDRAEMNRQMMKFQQEEGFNPLAGCLPMLLQIPVFIGLYHVLRHLANTQIANQYNGLCPGGKPGGSHLLSLYSFTPQQTCNGAAADLFGAPLAGSFRDSDTVIQALLGGDPSGSAAHTRIVILPLLLISAIATVVNQLMVRANQTVAPEGTAATIQRLMIWIIPVGVLASGLLFNFPLGVLLYWFTTNLWTLAQQAYIIRFHPVADEPVTPAGVTGKALAPKVGQRPQRPPKGGNRPVSVTKDVVGDDPDDVDDTSSSSPATTTGAQAARGSVPRPGQRPNRGKRPPAKRPTQAKKRR